MDKTQIIAALAVLTWTARIDRDPNFQEHGTGRAKRYHVADIRNLFDYGSRRASIFITSGTWILSYTPTADTLGQTDPA